MKFRFDLYQKEKIMNDKTLFYDLNLESLPPGVYFISVQSGQETLIEKILTE